MLGGVFFRHQPNENTLRVGPLVSSIDQYGMADISGSFKDKHVILVNAMRETTQQSIKAKAPYSHPETGCVIIAWARLDYRKTLFEKLSLPINELLNIPDNELILRAYLHWGENCAKHIFGDYSFAIYDPRSLQVFCARDHMGVRPFYYYITDKLFVFSTTQTFFHQLPDVPMEASEQWVARFLIHGSMDFEATAYKNIIKLKPAHALHVNTTRQSIKPFFKFDAYKIAQNLSSSECIDTYQEKLISAVESRCQTSYPLGSELSGGIDSSSVTGIAADVFPQSLKNFYTFGFAMLEKEPRCILPVSQKYGLANNFICCNAQLDNMQELLKRSIFAIGSPAEHGNAVHHEPFYKLCKTFNVRSLFSGFGGDEFVTTLHANIARYQLFHEKKYAALYNSLYGNVFTRFLRLLKLPYSYYSHIKPYSTQFLAPFKSRWQHCIIQNNTIQKYNLEKRYFDKAKFDSGYTNLNEFTLEKRWLPFVSTRMDNCSLVANSYGIDYSWPLLDVQLIEFFLSIPVEYKQPKGIYRYIHRKASEPFVPKEIIWQKNKYMGEPVRDRSLNFVSLQDDFTLHPMLEAMVEINKLTNQIKCLRSGSVLEKNRKMQLNRNVSIVNALNTWLNMLDKKEFAMGEVSSQNYLGI